MVQISDSLLELLDIDGKSSIRLLSERTFIHQIIELDRHAFTMSIAQSKTKASEH